MATQDRSLEERFAEVVELVRALGRRVDEFGVRLGALEARSPAPPDVDLDRIDFRLGGKTAAAIGWSGQSRALQRVAMVSFVLVVALILRTLTDSQVLGRGAGVVVGLGYCLVLVVSGPWLHARQRRGQRVLPACGAILACAIAVEAQHKFHLISAEAVHWILLADLLVVAAIGLRCGLGSLVATAVLTPSLAALTVGYPDLQFAQAAVLLLAVQVVLAFAHADRRLRWLAWTCLLPTLFFWFLWSLKARTHLLRPDQVPALALDVEWFAPLLFLFVVVQLGIAARRLSADPDDAASYYLASPGATVVWGSGAALAVLGARGGTSIGLGLGAFLIGFALFALAASLARRLHRSAPAIGAAASAATLAVLFGIVTTVAALPMQLALGALLTCGVGLFALRSASPGLRLFGLFLQVGVGLWAVSDGLYAVPSSSPLAAAGAGLVLLVSSAVFAVRDRVRSTERDGWLAHLDPNRRSGILALWATLLAGFGSLRVVLDRILALASITNPFAFSCGQSVVLNLVGTAMLLWGARSQDRRILATAVLVAVIGGAKVLGVDLLEASGVPLVLSVFTFGVTAATGSVVLARISRSSASAPQPPAEGERRDAS
ncbi:MAG: hypothetical protein U1F36_12830 [Planctomycetota bacterium]